MTPVVFSNKEFEIQKKGWQYSTYNMEFYKTELENLSPIRRNWCKKVCHVDEYEGCVGMNTISFKYRFKYEGDKVYFALIKPYSFSRLYSFIYELERDLRSQEQKYMEQEGELEGYIFKKSKNPKKKDTAQNLFKFENSDFIYSRDLLCYTNCGFPIDIISIMGKDKEFPKKIILVTSRVHASEVPGSFKLEQFLKNMVYPDWYAIELLKHFNIIIVPMLNPDGVTIGNTRTCYEGYDLNRCWDMPDKSSHAPIYYLKKMLKRLTKNNKEIFLFCDLHGHGKLPNSFIYACNKSAEGDFSSWTKMRLLPKLLSKLCQFFSYNNCQFRVEADKQSTGRVVLWKEFNVTSSFTLETSIYGYTSNNKCLPFMESDLYFIGGILVRAFYEYSKIMRELSKEMMLSKAYNFLFDQIDKTVQKDEKFPIIEIRKKSSVSPTKQEKQMTQNSFMIKPSESKEILKLNNSIAFDQPPQAHEAHNRTNTLTDLNKIEGMGEELVNAALSMSNWDSKPPLDCKEYSESTGMSQIKQKAFIKSKVMNFGGELASLRGKLSPKSRSITRQEQSRDDGPKEDSCICEQSPEKKGDETKPIHNVILRIREEGMKRKIGSSDSSKADKISKRNKSHDYCSRNKKNKEFIIYKIAPHIDISIGKIKYDPNVKSPSKEPTTSVKEDKPSVSKDNLQYVILNQLNVYPSILGNDCRAILNSPLTKAFDVFNHSNKGHSRFTFKSKLRAPQIYIKEKHYDSNLRKHSETKSHYLNEELLKKRNKSLNKQL